MAKWLRSQMQHLFVIAIVKEMGSSFKPHQRKMIFFFFFFFFLFSFFFFVFFFFFFFFLFFFNIKILLINIVSLKF